MSDDVMWTLEPNHVEWTMPWSKALNQDRPDELIFEKEMALAHLLMNGVVHLNDHWWEKELPERVQKWMYIGVNSNDIFAWACADSEELPYDQIERLYKLWRADGFWGIVKWCSTHVSMRPQWPVARDMKLAGKWDDEMERLPIREDWPKEEKL